MQEQAQEASVFRTMNVENNILSVMEMAGFDRDYRYERLESLLDEPFAGVDPIAVEDIQHIIANSALAINLTGR